MEPFDGIAAAAASLLGTSAEAAGLFLGLITVLVITFAFFIMIDKGEMEVGYIFSGVIVAFVIAIGWWPIWMAIFIALFIALAIIHPFSSSSG